jgi:hypothetical protein
MQKYLLAAILIGAFAVPAYAAEFHVMFDKTTKKCSVSKTPPTETEFSMMGIYGSEADAMMAMKGMTKCNKG